MCDRRSNTMKISSGPKATRGVPKAEPGTKVVKVAAQGRGGNVSERRPSQAKSYTCDGVSGWIRTDGWLAAPILWAQLGVWFTSRKGYNSRLYQSPYRFLHLIRYLKCNALFYLGEFYSVLSKHNSEQKQRSCLIAKVPIS